MSQDFIQLPDLTEIQEDLNLAKQDIESAVQADSSLEALGAFVIEVINIIEEKASAIKSMGKLEMKTKVDLAAHLTLLNSLMDEVFLTDLEEELEFEEGEEDEEEEKR